MPIFPILFFLARRGSRKAIFKARASFSAAFKGNAFFRKAIFSRNADFSEANFLRNVDFREAIFKRNAWFSEATFTKTVGFVETHFKGFTSFDECTFKGDTSYRATQVSKTFSLNEAKFVNVPNFTQAWFEEAPRLDNVNIEPQRGWRL